MFKKKKQNIVNDKHNFEEIYVRNLDLPGRPIKKQQRTEKKDAS